MGQYYKPINLDNKQWLLSHDYDHTGLKLMEHSWIGNDFVGAVMNLMVKGGDWFRKHIVWAGDYYGDQGNEIPYWNQTDGTDFTQIQPTLCMSEKDQQRAKLVNHTKKLYVRYDEILAGEGGWRINPLPLLTACGNGRGGGDYHDQYPDQDKVGIWAGDELSIVFAVPKSKWYKKIIVGFKE